METTTITQHTNRQVTDPATLASGWRSRFATYKAALTHAALVAFPLVFVLVEAAGRRAAP